MADQKISKTHNLYKKNNNNKKNRKKEASFDWDRNKFTGQQQHITCDQFPKDPIDESGRKETHDHKFLKKDNIQ